MKLYAPEMTKEEKIHEFKKELVQCINGTWHKDEFERMNMYPSERIRLTVNRQAIIEQALKELRLEE